MSTTGAGSVASSNSGSSSEDSSVGSVVSEGFQAKSEVEITAVSDALGKTTISDLLENTTEDNGKVEYKGSMVTRETKEVMEAVVDSMQHHFGDRVPDVKFTLDKLNHLKYDEKYKEKNEPPSDKWTSNVNIIYSTVNMSSQNIVAFDNVYIDLNTKLDSKKKPTKNYGKTWVTMYMKESTFSGFAQKFNKDTGWKVSAHKIQKDKTQGIVGLTVNFDEDDPEMNNSPPKFFVVKKTDGEITIRNEGTISKIYSDKDFRSMYRCTAFFTISVNIPVAVGSNKEPLAGSVSARVKFHLSAIRVFGVADNINPIKLGAKKVDGSLFG